jgi:hypothetical protein
LRLSEGFSPKNRAAFSQKLEKYRSIVTGLRQSPKQLKLKLEALRPEIVRLLKKKRTTNANKRLKNWMKENQSNATSYYRTPEKENTCPDYE